MEKRPRSGVPAIFCRWSGLGQSTGQIGLIAAPSYKRMASTAANQSAPRNDSRIVGDFERPDSLKSTLSYKTAKIGSHQTLGMLGRTVHSGHGDCAAHMSAAMLRHGVCASGIA
jgi:hypothetical protein